MFTIVPQTYGTCVEKIVIVGHHAFSNFLFAFSHKYKSYGTFLQHFLLLCRQISLLNR